MTQDDPSNHAPLLPPADNELVFKDATGGLSIFDAESLTSRVLVTNITFVSIGVPWLPLPAPWDQKKKKEKKGK